MQLRRCKISRVAAWESLSSRLSAVHIGASIGVTYVTRGVVFSHNISYTDRSASVDVALGIVDTGT